MWTPQLDIYPAYVGLYFVEKTSLDIHTRTQNHKNQMPPPCMRNIWTDLPKFMSALKRGVLSEAVNVHQTTSTR